MVSRPLIFYITGHGFGHASRSLEIINAIAIRQPSPQIVVRTSVPRWFLDASARTPLEIQPADTDTGMVQIDSLRLDVDATSLRAADFYRTFEGRVTDEASIIRRLDPGIVVADIPPLALAAAHRAGVPSVAVGNFTWDWIYADYPQFERLAPGVLECIRAAYATTTLALRLPFHGGFTPMAPVTTDIPLVARKARLSSTAVRHELGLTGPKPVVLASFGGHGLRLPYREIAADGRFTLVLTDFEAGAGSSTDDIADHPNLLLLTPGQLIDRNLRYADLVASADVVVSKPGYGIISECIANQTALLYTSRGHFVEQAVFEAEMPRYLRCQPIDYDDLIGGQLADRIDQLLRQPAPPESMRADGASVAADRILALVGSE